MLRTTEYNRRDADKIYMELLKRREDLDPIQILKNLQPVIYGLLQHIDDLQAEVNGLRRELKGEK